MIDLYYKYETANRMKQFTLLLLLFGFIQNSFGQFEEPPLLSTDTKQGRMVYNVADDPEATSTSLLEIIRKISVFRVDASGELSLLGNSHITLSIDGVQQTLPMNSVSNYLAAFAANEVDRIELNLFPAISEQTITEGAIINIVTRKRAKDGLSVSLGAHGATSTLLGTNATFNLKYKKFFFNGNYDYDYQNYTDFKQTQRLSDSYVVEDKYDVRHTKNHRSFLNAGFDITKNDKLSVAFSIYRKPWEITKDENQGIASSASRIEYVEKVKQEYIQVAASYQHLWKNDGRVALTYEYGEAPQNILQSVTTFSTEYSIMEAKYNYFAKSHAARLDISLPFKEFHYLNLGGKYSWYENKYSYSITSDDINWGNRGQHNVADSHFWNAYLQYVFNVRHFNFQAGVKIQKPFKLSDWFDDDIQILPSASLNFISDKYSFSMGYTMQSSLPPSHHILTESNLWKVNKLYMNYDYTNAGFSLLTTLSYQFSKDGKDIYTVSIPGTGGYYSELVSGGMKSKQTLLSALSSYRISSLCAVNLSATVGYTDLRKERDEPQENINYYGFGGNIIAGADFNLPANYKIGINGGYYFSEPGYYARSYDNYFYRLNVSKNFLNDKLSLAVHAADFFKTEKKLKVKDDKSEPKLYVPGLEFGLSLVYRFQLDF